MNAPVLPEFRRRRERRYKGIITMAQSLAGVVIALTVFMALNVHWMAGAAVAALGTLVFVGLSPAEGELYGLLWAYRARAWLARETKVLASFAETLTQTERAPLVLFDGAEETQTEVLV